MGITLKGWEKAKSAEPKTSEFEPFPEGRNIEAVVTELSSKLRDGDPEKVDFMLKLETTDEKAAKGAKFYSCYPRTWKNAQGEEKSTDGQRDVDSLIRDIKAMGYDLEEGDGATPEDVMKAVAADKPIVLVNCVAKGKYRNIYLQQFVGLSSDNGTEEETTEEPAAQDEPSEGGFIPEQGMLVNATPKSCRKVEEYKVVAVGDSDCVLKRIRDKEIYEDVTFDKVFSEVD